MAQASGSSHGSDQELRSSLKNLGFSPGPITETTRGLYLEKLKLLELETKPRAGSGQSSGSSLRHDSRPKKAASKAADGATQTLDSYVTAAESRDSLSTTWTTTSTVPSSPSLPVPASLPPLPSSPPLSPLPSPSHSPPVIASLLYSLNNVSHLASDTAFLFPDGDVFLASRAVLSTQCSEMIPLLYSREDPFSVTVCTVSGHVSKFFARPSELVLDLKQKIALSENVSIPEQQLVFEQSELRNENVIGRTGLREGSRVHLTLATPPLGHPQQTTYFTSCVNPSLSITHFQLGLGLEQLVGVASPRLRPLRVPLPPHIFHIVHVYDVPYHAWVELIYYLYSRQLKSACVCLGTSVCCHMLAIRFNLPSLSQLTACHIERQLTADSALTLLQFADSIQSQPLRDLSTAHLKQMEG